MRLFNGYTGLFISDYGTTRIYLEKFFPDILTDKMLKAIGIEYIKIDKKFISKDELSKIKSFYNKKIIFENNQALTIKLDKNNDLATINNIELGFTGDHAYGKDRKLYINLLFKNNSKKYFANKNQDKIKLLLTFYRDEKIVRKKEIFNLYPLLIYPEQNRQVTFDIYEKPGFNKLRIDIFNVNKHVSSLTSKL